MIKPGDILSIHGERSLVEVVDVWDERRFQGHPMVGQPLYDQSPGEPLRWLDYHWYGETQFTLFYQSDEYEIVGRAEDGIVEFHNDYGLVPF